MPPLMAAVPAAKQPDGQIRLTVGQINFTNSSVSPGKRSVSRSSRNAGWDAVDAGGIVRAMGWQGGLHGP